MDKTILRKFAIESRQDLMEKIKNKINTFYVDEEFKNEQKGDLYILSNEKHSLSLTNDEYKKRELLIKRIKELSLEQVIEEAAYTWFNRIIAIRYMEINDMLPLTKDNQSLGIRVLSSKDNTPDPDILKFTNLNNSDLDIEFRKEKYAELRDDNEKFKYVLLLICKKLGKVIPQVFDGVTDYIDILVPDNLLNDTGFITKVITEVPEENFNKVEIIGWLYQYYNQVEKDRVITSKKTYKKNEIPYATQLFTPDWIVKYMVENSLGKYWLERHFDNNLLSDLKYIIKDNIRKIDDRRDIKNLTFIDPCCGSGHVLVYAFDLLYKMYLSVGYNKNDIAELILKNNLYGLDIDDRAGQLSILSVLLKAREYDKNIFKKSIVKDINILSIQEISSNSLSYYESYFNENEYKKIEKLLELFKNGKEIGSLINIDQENYDDIKKTINKDDTIFGIELKRILLPLIKQAEILSNKYKIVVTNPPYMNYTLMSDNLKKYVKKYYSAYSSDLFETSIRHFLDMLEDNCYFGCVTPYAWMFLKSYKDLRKYIIDNCDISSLVQLEYNSFEACALPVCIYVLSSSKLDKDGIYIKLTDFQGVEVQEPKLLEALSNYDNCSYIYKTNIENYKLIDLNPIAYWITDKEFDLFKNGKKFGDYYSVKGGMTTGNNGLFMRKWYEVDFNKIGIGLTSEQAKKSKYKWFPYNKGGLYRKWYGNLEYIVDWKNDGEDIKNYKLEQRKLDPKYNTAIAALDSMFKIQYSWSLLSGCNLSVRYYPIGCLFDVSGSSVVLEEPNTYILGLLNSNIVNRQLNFLNPTLNTQPGNIKSLAFIDDSEFKEEIDKLVNENIEISKEDWDLSETSWDFKRNCLLEIGESKIENNYLKFKEKCQKRIARLKHNEEILNKIYNKIYGLEDVVSSEVDEKNISLNNADERETIVGLISYAVGCMFGRYSLDSDGLKCTNTDIDMNQYQMYKADSDNIIPITDEAYFGDDIVERFKKFLEVAFSRDTINDNINYIADVLGKKGTETSEERIRRYFNDEFFDEHIKMYQKNPIYWLFDSGKKNGFKALIYIHRYNENVVPKIRLDYLHRIQTTYEKILSDINYKLTTELSMNEKKEIQKKQAELNAKLQETIMYDEKIAHIANQRISIDLDDGVKENYEKFKDILAKIK